MAEKNIIARKTSIRKNPRHHGFEGIWIRSAIYKIPELSPIDRELVSFVWGFSETERGCDASNPYMADLFHVHTSTVKRSVAKLKGLHLIINTGPDRRHRVLKVNPGVITAKAREWDEGDHAIEVDPHQEDRVKMHSNQKAEGQNVAHRGQNAPDLGSNCAGDRGKMQPLIKKDIIKNNKNNKGASPTPLPAERAGSGDACGSMKESYESMEPAELLKEYERGGWAKAYIDKHCPELVAKARKAVI